MQLCQQKAYIRTVKAGRFVVHNLSCNTDIESWDSLYRATS